MFKHDAQLQTRDPELAGAMESICDSSRSSLLDRLTANRLIWIPEAGVGYYPVTEAPYDAAYFERYQNQADTEIGRNLMELRCAMVDRFTHGAVLDIGIGSGAFIERRGNVYGRDTYGFDVNPAGVAWLKARNLFIDPYAAEPHAITCWDVLEHIHDFRPLLARVRNWVFVSLPIFSGPEHVARSKHFRPDEHCWYFTRSGLVRVFSALGFDHVEINTDETKAGREDIESFAFHRR